MPSRFLNITEEESSSSLDLETLSIDSRYSTPPVQPKVQGYIFYIFIIFTPLGGGGYPRGMANKSPERMEKRRVNGVLNNGQDLFTTL